MKKFFNKFNKNQTGFTLIELLIVIVILGVLAAAIIPNLSKFVGSGELGAANAELASVNTAISAYQADNTGSLPTATPAAGGVVVNTLIQGVAGYVTGTVKGVYTIDAQGLPLSATNGSWSVKIRFLAGDGKWIKTPPP